MFDRVLGLPAHPLMVHAAVVLVPLLALAAVAYAVAPRVRPHLRWTVIFLAITAPGAVFAASESGEALSAHENLAAPQMQQQISSHEDFGDVLLWLTLGLGVVALALTFLVRTPRARPTAADGDTPTARPTQPMAVQLVLVVLTVGLAAASLFYVFKAGDTGASMVWTGF